MTDGRRDGQSGDADTGSCVDTQTHRHTDRKKNKQTNALTDTHTQLAHKYTDKQTHRQTSGKLPKIMKIIIILSPPPENNSIRTYIYTF